MSNIIKAKGVILKYGDAASPTTTITGKTSITTDLGQWDRVETTNHDTAGQTKTYDTTLKEPASMDVEIFMDPADTGHAWLIAAHSSGLAKYFEFILPDAGAAEFDITGHVTNLSINPAYDNMIRATFTVSGTGAYTFTA